MLCCPNCHKSLVKKGSSLLCARCGEKLTLTHGIVVNSADLPSDLLLSNEKWNHLYKQDISKKVYEDKYREYLRLYFQDTYEQLHEVKPIHNIVYLEIGCGEFALGQAIANKCAFIIGVDLSLNALRIAQALLKKHGIRNYLLIQSDIHHMPIKNNTVGLIYGGGVIEHFKDTGSCIDELYRVLKRNGISFNTVPYLNIGSLTYRQVWGNIPNFPVLKQFAEFIHIKLLGAKHMMFGYEMSFTKRTLISVHKQSGFRKILVAKFRTTLSFEFMPKLFRPFFIYLADNSPFFWPMVKVIGTK